MPSLTSVRPIVSEIIKVKVSPLTPKISEGVRRTEFPFENFDGKLLAVGVYEK
jgi:hypothetical protein